MVDQGAFGTRILYQGTAGEDVAELQRRLESLGYAVGPIDGIFGPKTKEAVMKFQRDHGLVVDGIVGEETYDMLEQLIP